jgi:hypothetical protein
MRVAEDATSSSARGVSAGCTLGTSHDKSSRMEVRHVTRQERLTCIRSGNVEQVYGSIRGICYSTHVCGAPTRAQASMAYAASGICNKDQDRVVAKS